MYQSGYHYDPYMNGGMLIDTYYGSKMPMGFVPIGFFFEHLQTGKQLDKRDVPHYHIKSLKDAWKILSNDLNSRWFNEGFMSFRGQVREFFIHRPIPNPFMAIPQKGERLIVPSLHRPFIGQPFNDQRLKYDTSLLVSWDADDLIYYGIPDYATLPLRNFEKYGIHTMSDLADFPDADSREYYHRWQTHKIDGIHSLDVPLLEQHYGIDTAGLDVTFDLTTALFFATNQFAFLDKQKYIATYTPIPKGQHEGIVYCLVFLRDPKITKSGDKINQIGMFQHIPPVRPIRQSCAIPFFSSMEINAAATDLHAIFILDKDFDTRGLPKKEYLFPDIHRDPFYKALLDIKKKKPAIWGKIVEYKF